MLSTKEAIELSKNKPVDEKKAESAAELAELRLVKLQWLEHPVTKALIKYLSEHELNEIASAVACKSLNRDQDALNRLVSLEQIRVIKHAISSPNFIFGNAHTTNNQE